MPEVNIYILQILSGVFKVANQSARNTISYGLVNSKAQQLSGKRLTFELIYIFLRKQARAIIRA